MWFSSLRNIPCSRDEFSAKGFIGGREGGDSCKLESETENVSGSVLAADTEREFMSGE